MSKTQQLSGIYTRNKMGLDNKVWLTLLITVLLSAGLFGFRIMTTEPCFDIALKLKGVVEHPFANDYFVGESVIFEAGMQRERDVQWDFGDGTAVATGSKVTHSYSSEGNFLVTATVNGKCLQSVNVHISQVNQPAVVPQPPSVDPYSIIGKDFAAAGELCVYQTEAPGPVYEWSIEGNAAFPVKNGNKVAYSFTDPGAYTIKLMLDNDDTKVYRKTVTVSANPATARGAELNDLPPLPLPALPKEAPAGGGTAPAAAEAPAEKKRVDLIPDPILKNQLQDIIEGKESLENMAQYMCEGMNGKVKGNGKIYANLSLFGEELKGKKGMLGLGGKRKIKSVHANREVGSNCIFRLDVEYK